MRPPKTDQSAFRTPLNRILGAEANVRLLRVLTLEPHPLTRAELGRRASLETKGAHLASQRLEDAGIVRRVGTGPRQQVALAAGHPLAAALQGLFRAEQTRVDRVLDALRAAARSLGSELRAAWIQGPFAALKDLPGEPIVVGILSRGDVLPGLANTLRETVEQTEIREDVTIEIKSFTEADIRTATAAQRRELATVIALVGVAPGFLDSASSTQARKGRTIRHSTRDEQHQALAREVARHLVTDPAKRQQATRWIRKRLKEASTGERKELVEWLAVLKSMSPSRLDHFLKSDSERAIRLRQTLPFLNVLSPNERAEALQRVRKK